ncbi:MAG: hypothetical protein ACRD3M_01700 [Thermoanaerobaculia bacterium]
MKGESGLQAAAGRFPRRTGRTVADEAWIRAKLRRICGSDREYREEVRTLLGTDRA